MPEVEPAEPRVEPTEPDGRPPPTDGQPAPTSDPATPAAEEQPDVPTDLGHLVTTAPAGVMERLRFSPGEAIGRPGLFFMQVDTGVQTPTGAVQAIGDEAPPLPGSDTDVSRLEVVRRGAEVAVISESGFYDPLRRDVVRVRRYSWLGERLAERFVPNWGRFSPDGQLAYWGENLGPATSGLTVAGGTDLAPRFRIKGVRTCGGGRGSGCWLADSSGLVVAVRGGYRILRPDGTLEESPALDRADARNRPLPAPNRPDRFAVGCTVVDAGGRTLSAPVAREEGEPWIGMACGGWDSTGNEIQVGLYTAGKGADPPLPLLDPVLERPPFPATVTLGVNLPPGDCLNLRLGYGLQAPVQRCLPGGTRLAPATPPGRVNKGWIEGTRTLADTGWGDAWWLHVRTDQGERGWVAYSPEWLAWVPPPEDGSLPSDPLTASIEDAVANMQHWLQVALGEQVCGEWCGQAFPGEVTIGLISQCRHRGPDRFRHADGYDPDRHGPTVESMTQACTTLVSTRESLDGYPGDTPEWRQSLRDALATLSE